VVDGSAVSTPAHERFAHEAVFHDGPDALAAELAAAVLAGMAVGDAVLVCLRDREWWPLRDALGPRAAAVVHIAPDVRYSRPGVAMATVRRFADEALAGGAATAWSIGAIPFERTARDRRWVRYEAAVDEVLGSLPLRAVCAYDTATTPAAMLDAARRTHGPHRSEPVMASAGRPPTAPVFGLRDATPAAVRAALGRAFAGTLDAERLDDVLLIASELVTNARRHGAPPVAVRAWSLDGGMVLEVTDRGTGLVDRYPDLRPNRGTSDGGYGWWLVGQLADDVDVASEGGRTTVTVGVRAA
jgi:anti-sigma regulatory factor (Ser/Thr protein kinase)